MCQIQGVRRILSVVLVGAGLGAAACKGGRGVDANKAREQAPGEVVARIGDQVITTGDLEAIIKKEPPYAQARFASPEKKKELLENVVRFEVMAREAKARGYESDPDVQRAVKQEMIRQLVQKEIDTPLTPESVPEAEVARYYEQNQGEFAKPEQVRVSHILIKDRARADKLAAEARAAKRDDHKAFRDLVTKHSQDEDSKQRGGDLTFFDRETSSLPKPLVEAAFALEQVGDVSAPVETAQGWHVLKLTQRRPGFTRTLADVRRDIQMRLHREAKAKRLEAMESEMRGKVKVEIYENELAKVKVPAAPEAAVGGARLPGP